MKKIFVVLSLICANSHATLSVPSQVNNGTSGFISSCVRAIKSVLPDSDKASCLVAAGADIMASGAIWAGIISSINKNNTLQMGVMRKKADYLKAGIIDKRQNACIGLLLKKSALSVDYALKYAPMIGVFAPMVTYKTKTFPLALSIGATVLPTYRALLKQNQRLKLTSYYLDHPGLSIDFLK